MACSDCPNGPMGCWPECKFPMPTYVSNNTSDPAPAWVKLAAEEVQRRKDVARLNSTGRLQ